MQKKDGTTKLPKIESTAELADRVAEDPWLEEEMRKDPIKMLSAIAKPTPLEYDEWIYRIVVLALGSAVVGAIGGAIFLAFQGKNQPEFLVAIGSAAVGALAGLLTPTPSSKA
ncbi:hypothetical protein ES708_33648 [subsurface metagenome]